MDFDTAFDRLINPKDFGELLGKVDALAATVARIDEKTESLPAVQGRLARIEPLVDEHEQLKNKGWGMLISFSVISAAAGALGHHITDWMHK